MSSLAADQKDRPNPFLQTRVDEFGDTKVLFELKLGLVFFVQSPPGPKTARYVFDMFMNRFGHLIKRYTSTTPGDTPHPWNEIAATRIKNTYLPSIRKTLYWGYAFDDNQILNSHLFMMHGYRPVTESGKTSFFRFEFPWDIDPTVVLNLANDFASTVPFLHGSAGYFLRIDPQSPEAYDAMYAICQRHWGIEACNLDVTVKEVSQGFKTVNWLTFIGETLAKTDKSALHAGRSAALNVYQHTNGLIFQASEAPIVGDCNRQDFVLPYAHVASALRPLQINIHGSFGGEKWTSENSLRWIHRFDSIPGIADSV